MSKSVRPFIDTLRDLEGGYLLDDLSSQQTASSTRYA